MKPDEGRLQTAEHVLLAILKQEHGVKAGVSKFYADRGTLEVHTDKDMKLLDTDELARKVDEVALRDLPVKRTPMPRAQAAKLVDLGRIPQDAKEVTVVDIVGFYAAACRDPHVARTSEIGKFFIIGVERAGKDRYRFEFSVG